MTSANSRPVPNDFEAGSFLIQKLIENHVAPLATPETAGIRNRLNFNDAFTFSNSVTRDSTPPQLG